MSTAVLPFSIDKSTPLFLDKNTIPILNAISFDPAVHYKSVHWLLPNSITQSNTTILVNLYCSNGSQTLTNLPQPLPSLTSLIIIHPNLSQESIQSIISPLSPSSISIWNPFPLITTINGSTFYSLSPLSPCDDPLLLSTPLNIHALASSLYNSTNLNPNSIKISLLGPMASNFLDVYTQIYTTATSKLSDKQKAVILANSQIPNSNHLVIVDRFHYSLPLNIIDTSYLGIISIYYKDFSKIKLQDGNSKTTTTFNLFNKDDPILPILINKDFAEIPQILNTLAKSLQIQFSKKDNLTTIDEMKLFVGDLSSLDVKRNWLAKHTNLVTEIFSKLDTNIKLPNDILNNLFEPDETEFNLRLSIQSEIQDFNPNQSPFNFISKSTITSSNSKSNSNSTTQSILKEIERYFLKFKQFKSTLKLITLLNSKSNLQINQLTPILQMLTRYFPMKSSLNDFTKCLNKNPLLPLPNMPENSTHVVFLGPITPKELSTTNNNQLFFTSLYC